MIVSIYLGLTCKKKIEILVLKAIKSFSSSSKKYMRGKMYLAIAINIEPNGSENSK